MKLRTSVAYLFFALLILMMSCNNSSDQNNADVASIGNNKIATAISCTINGLTPEDSTLYANGGGNDFKETILNKNNRPASVPSGMVWIPGGEFSMGGVNPVGIKDGGHEQMNDARPVHRVYVDDFYMDATEVTNAEFAKFIKATGYVTVAEQKPTHEEFPDAPEESLVAGSVVFSPPAEQ